MSEEEALFGSVGDVQVEAEGDVPKGKDDIVVIEDDDDMVVEKEDVIGGWKQG